MRCSDNSARLDAQARGHLKEIKRSVQSVYSLDEPFDANVILGRLGAFLASHPMRAATRAQVAVHEAGHLVGFEFGGLVAGKAQIYGTPFGRGGWGGKAFPLNPPCYSEGQQHTDPDQFLHDARAALAGPLAEDLISCGDAPSSIGELVAARVIAERAAELLNRDEAAVWREILRGAIALVERYEVEIRDIAELLARRRRIDRFQPSTRKILRRVTQTPINTTLVSERGKALFHRIEDSLMELAQ